MTWEPTELKPTAIYGFMTPLPLLIAACEADDTQLVWRAWPQPVTVCPQCGRMYRLRMLVDVAGPPAEAGTPHATSPKEA